MKQYSNVAIILKTTVIHTATYFVLGMLALVLMDYTAKYADPAVAILMRPTDHPLVAGGSLFQVPRGLLFGLVFCALQDIVIARKHGWLPLWLTLVVVGIISPFGAAPGSIEGVVYTGMPVWFHIQGLPEVLVQSFLLAWLTHFWVNHPKKWFSWIAIVVFALALLMSTMGLLAGLGILQAPA